MRGTLVRRTWEYDPARYAPPRFRRACHYESFVPDGLSAFDEPFSADLVGVVSDAETAVHRLNAHARPALAPLARLLLRTESIASSKVEGMQVDARDLARAEARLETGGKAGSTAAEILANIDAMELAIDHASGSSAVTVPDLVGIHAALMATAPNAHVAGVVRIEQNWIGGNNYNPCGASFVGPPPAEVPRLLADLCAAINDDALPPVIQAGLVHAQFEAIHPFLDGNGRTGRALIHVVLRRRGLTPMYVPPISVVLAGDKGAYIAGLDAYVRGDIDAWLTTFAVATAQSAVLASSYLARVEALQDQWRAMLRTTANPRADSVAWALIDVMPAHPMISVPVAVAATGRTKAVVNEALLQLEAAGVLTRASQGQRNRTWEAAGLLDLLADLEAGVTLPPPGA
ncbi:MAG: Fic family protein [Actinomycetota bacterium]|nr:Fic family protein [Actinomycetota bacterium]